MNSNKSIFTGSTSKEAPKQISKQTSPTSVRSNAIEKDQATAAPKVPGNTKASSTVRSNTIEKDQATAAPEMPGNTKPSSTAVTIQGKHYRPENFYIHDHYGLTSLAEHKHYEAALRLAKVLSAAIGSGGEYTTRQADWIKGMLVVKGIDRSVIAQVDESLKEASELMDLEVAFRGSELLDTQELREKQGPRLVYELYRAAAVENFPEQQLCVIAMMAAEWPIGKEPGRIEKIKALVEKEMELRKERINLLFPEGHPYMDPYLQ